ncbi:MAG: hypothetical protein ACYC2R_15820 [Burkholderiales bacterium]
MKKQALPRPETRVPDVHRVPKMRSEGRGISNHILPTSATMTGVCITVISIVRLIETHHRARTIIDNLMAINGLVFLVSCFMSYISIRRPQLSTQYERYADMFFLFGLLLMVLGGFLLAWEFERF